MPVNRLRFHLCSKGSNLRVFNSWISSSMQAASSMKLSFSPPTSPDWASFVSWKILLKGRSSTRLPMQSFVGVESLVLLDDASPGDVSMGDRICVVEEHGRRAAMTCIHVPPGAQHNKTCTVVLTELTWGTTEQAATLSGDAVADTCSQNLPRQSASTGVSSWNAPTHARNSW